MKTRIWVLVAVVAGALLIAAPFLLPKGAVELESAGTGGAVVATAAWQGGDAVHKASGTLEMVDLDGQAVLRFRNFTMTEGPDVYLYLTGAGATSTEDVEGGLRVLVETDADPDGRINERGSFDVPLGIPVEEADYARAVAWCDDFNVLFATADF